MTWEWNSLKDISSCTRLRKYLGSLSSSVFLEACFRFRDIALGNTFVKGVLWEDLNCWYSSANYSKEISLDYYSSVVSFVFFVVQIWFLFRKNIKLFFAEQQPLEISLLLKIYCCSSDFVYNNPSFITITAICRFMLQCLSDKSGTILDVFSFRQMFAKIKYWRKLKFIISGNQKIITTIVCFQLHYFKIVVFPPLQIIIIS